jgi:hypothetical protein
MTKPYDQVRKLSNVKCQLRGKIRVGVIMPLIQSDTQAATEANFRELGAGKTYAGTKKKYGKKKANKQRIAIVLNKQRKAAQKKQARKRA